MYELLFVSWPHQGFLNWHQINVKSLVCFRVNPVTGRWEAAKHNPSDEMSEEQKEYEAMQLVQQFDRLARYGASLQLRLL